MAEIRQSKVKKTLILSTRHICSVTPITSAHVHVLGHIFIIYMFYAFVVIAVQFFPLEFDDFSVEIGIGCFFFPPLLVVS